MNLTTKNLFETLAHLRFYIFEGRGNTKVLWKLYESCPEEGEDVKKRIGQYATEQEARKALNKARSEFVKKLNESFRVTGNRKTKIAVPKEE